MRLRLQQELPEYNWSGRASTLCICADEPVEDLLHEAAHALVAPPLLRKFPEWGLGMSNLARRCPDVHVRNPDMVEHRASLLGIIWLKTFSRKLALEVWEEHGWDERNVSPRWVRIHLRWLLRRKLIEWRGGKLRVKRY